MNSYKQGQIAALEKLGYKSVLIGSGIGASAGALLSDPGHRLKGAIGGGITGAIAGPIGNALGGGLGRAVGMWPALRKMNPAQRGAMLKMLNLKEYSDDPRISERATQAIRAVFGRPYRIANNVGVATGTLGGGLLAGKMNQASTMKKETPKKPVLKNARKKPNVPKGTQT